MTETLYDAGAPTIVVKVYRDDRVLLEELCETEEEAQAVVDRWSEEGNVSFVVDDLSTRHRAEDVLAPEPSDGYDDEADVELGLSSIPARGTE